MQATLNHLCLCSGIGGFSLAAKIVGSIETVGFCEINPFCQSVLRKNFPGKPIISDIHEVTTAKLAEIRIHAVDIITAGIPCQPHSLSGKRQGSADPRDLWGELYRVVCEIQPRWLVIENVPGIITTESGQFFRRILWQLAKAGYDAEWDVISCAEVGGCHRRERFWLIATDTKSNRRATPRHQKSQAGPDTTPICGSLQNVVNRRRGRIPVLSITGTASQPDIQRSPNVDCRQPKTFPQLRRENDGVSNGVDRPYLMSPEDIKDNLRFAMDTQNLSNRKERLMALGNAIVPQVACIPLKRILAQWRYQNEDDY